MKAMLVKICGITNIDDALDAVEFGADALGFNFYPDSPRYIDPEWAASIMDQIPPSVWKVGLFVNENEETIHEIHQICNLDYLQFHGEETPEDCEKFELPYWKAFRLGDEGDVEDMKAFHCDYYVVDTNVEKMYGGTGIVGNWDLAKMAKKVGPIFLAGGLNPQNIAMAIAATRPEGVDVCSGVESELGKKDRFKLEEFINKAKRAGGEG